MPNLDLIASMRNDLPVPPTPVRNMFQIGALTYTGLVLLLMKEVLLHQLIDTSLVLVHHRHTLGQIDLVGSAVLQIAHIIHGRLHFSLNLGSIVTASVIFDVDRWWLVFLPSLVDFLHLITSCQYLMQLVMVEVRPLPGCISAGMPLRLSHLPEEASLLAERQKQTNRSSRE